MRANLFDIHFSLYQPANAVGKGKEAKNNCHKKPR